jgi:hypothetical protein
VSQRDAIAEIFVGLERGASLATALRQAVRVACEAADCAAGALSLNADPTHPDSHLFPYDPNGLFQTAFGGGDDSLHAVKIPLDCDGRAVGRLILLAPAGEGERELTARMGGARAALALLMVAVESAATGSASSLLSGEAFCERVHSELSRAERTGAELSVLHVRLVPSPTVETDESCGPWTRAAWIGARLADKLRKGDVVGLPAPDCLLVLLAGTGRIGGRIAARRIEQILHSQRDAPDGDAEVEVQVRSFPSDAKSAEDLLDTRRSNTQPSARPLEVAQT